MGLSSIGSLPVEQQFTIIVNTFKRPDNLKAAIRHYQTCAGVAAIRVVWSEQVTQPVVPGGISLWQGAFWDYRWTTARLLGLPAASTSLTCQQLRVKRRGRGGSVRREAGCATVSIGSNGGRRVVVSVLVMYIEGERSVCSDVAV